MRAFAAFIMRGRLQAVAIVVTATALSLLVPPAIYFGAAALALVTLRQGLRAGVQVALGATAVTAVGALALVGTWLPALAYLLVVWVPTGIVAGVLRSTVSLRTTMIVATGMGVALVLLVHLRVNDVAAMWRDAMDRYLLPTMEQSGIAVNGGDWSAAMAAVAPVMTGALIAFTLVGVLAALFTARWWQALLYNPGVALGLVALTVAALLLPGWGGALAVDLIPVVLLTFVVAGLGLAHGLVAKRRAGIGWLVGLYVLLVVVVPQLMLFVVASAALLDVWLDFRSRVPARQG